MAREIHSFIKCKVYMAAVGLVALCGYGFAIAHPAIGMDDTAMSLYFEEGVAPYMGRWCIFVLNKVFRIRISGFAPWMAELVSVLILILSVTLWCVLWRRVCEPKVNLPRWSYLFVAGIFLSCPLISEVFVFYLHNGICTGYGVTALSLLCLLESFSAENTGKRRWGYVACSALLLTVALGFYESFVMVYVMGGTTVFLLLRRLYGKDGRETRYGSNVREWMRNGFLAVASSVLLRAAILFVLKISYRLERLDKYDVPLHPFFRDNFKVEGELVMNLKRFWVMYYVNGIVYLPIAVLVVSLAAIGLYSLYHGWRKRDFAIPLCGIAMILLPVLMSVVEGMPTYYRAAQYVPMVGAFAVLLLLVEVKRRGKSGRLSVVCGLLLSALIYNQCADLNRWFYLDYRKYQNAVEVMNRVAYDLQTGFDVEKPLVFRGAYRVPYEISKDAYCGFSSPQYRWICRVTDPVDPHLKEKYFAENGRGYVFAQSPIVSVLQWGLTAFDGTCGQLMAFWNMHGHSFPYVTDPAIIEEAERIRVEEDMPGYPRDGYILECEDIIIVNLEHE